MENNEIKKSSHRDTTVASGSQISLAMVLIWVLLIAAIISAIVYVANIDKVDFLRPAAFPYLPYIAASCLSISIVVGVARITSCVEQILHNTKNIDNQTQELNPLKREDGTYKSIFDENKE